MKIKLVYQEPVSLIDPAIKDFVEPWFDLERFDPANSYDPGSTVLVIPYVNAGSWAFDLQRQGFRVAVDNLWEPTSRYLASQGYQQLIPERTHEIRSDCWFWYHEQSRLNHSHCVGLEPRYQPQRTLNKKAFMPMRDQRWHRDEIFEYMKPLFGDFYYSYQARGIFLPNDIPAEDPSCQRYYHPSWYNDTWFSLAVETYVDEYDVGIWGHERKITYLGPWPFITEKTFKPIAMQHPFMVYGQSGTLQQLKTLGFETFDNLFDESYDQRHSKKLKILYSNVENFDCTGSGYDSLTLKKIEHNYQLFFDTSRVKSGMLKDIIEPLLEYANQT